MTKNKTDNLENIGQLLKEKRLSIGVEISEASSYLRVKDKDIIALENNNLNPLSQNLYVFGIISSYAKFLKIDQKIIRDSLKNTNKRNKANSKIPFLASDHDQNLSPDKNSFFNFLLISVLLSSLILISYNIYQKNSDLINNKFLIERITQINQNYDK